MYNPSISDPADHVCKHEDCCEMELPDHLAFCDACREITPVALLVDDLYCPSCCPDGDGEAVVYPVRKAAPKFPAPAPEHARLYGGGK